ncbi:MAG: hypothetical protein HQK52_07680 [Oligoflexia bacterium]|nr:hypothetical protein [Oligoflexia bacterium]
MDKRFLVLIFILAAGLRLIGIGSGLPTDELRQFPDHCDETASLHFLSQMNWKEGRFNPVAAHEEGTLSVYLWMAGGHIAKGLGLIKRHSHQLVGPGKDYSNYVIYGRVVVTFFDLASLFLIFFILRRINFMVGASENSTAPYWGMLIWAILPFEVIHSHYMRAHVLGNTLLLIIIYLSLFLKEEKSKIKTSMWIGLVVGLAAANRYTYIVSMTIPLAFLFVHKIFWDKRVLIIPLFALVGFFIGDMPLFLDFESAKGPILYQLSFKLQNVPWYDFSRALVYITEILPIGTWALWIIFYPALFFILYEKRYRLLALSWCAFMLVYFVPASKNYPLYAIRLLLPLFPFFTLAAALLLQNLFIRTRHYAAVTVVSFIFISTTLFTFATVTAMADRKSSPFVQFYNYFKELKGEQKQLSFGLLAKGWDWYQINNFNAILDSVPINFSEVKRSDSNYLDPTQKVNYIIVFKFDHTNSDVVDVRMNELLISKQYRLEKVFKRKISIFNVEVDYQFFPTDFRYHFPEIYLLAAQTP